ncbi:MAG: S4 domain-containing protein, partial [Thermoleophilia bacterium]
MTRPEPAPLRLRVDADLAGTRLDSAVGAMEQVGSRAEAQRLIDAGRVLVDGAVQAKRHRVAEGEILEVRPAPAPLSDLEPEDSVPF